MTSYMDAVRVKDPIFETIQKWNADHPNVKVSLSYDTVNLYVHLEMELLGTDARIKENIHFDAYNATSQEQLTLMELNNMYKELMKLA